MAENPNMDTPQSYWTSFERLHTETARFWAGLVEVAPPEIDANTRILADASEEFASHVRQLDPSSEDIADAFNSTTSADEVLDRLGVRRDMLNEESVTTKMSELESYADANCPERTRS